MVAQPSIGNVNQISISGAGKLHSSPKREEKAYFYSIPFEFISMFIGLIDGDGYLAITQANRGYIRIELILSLNVRDLDLLKYLLSVLKIGRVNIYPNINTAKFIMSKGDLKEVFFPLIIHHDLFFLTKTRCDQFNKALYILQKEILKFEIIPECIPATFTAPNTPQDYKSLPFFEN